MLLHVTNMLLKCRVGDTKVQKLADDAKCKIAKFYLEFK